MKIETSIKARRDGTVRMTIPSGEVAVFKEDGDGVLVCELSDAQDIDFVLGMPGFYPQDDGVLTKPELLAKAKELGVPDVNGRMSASTIAEKIDAFVAKTAGEGE